MNKLYIVDFKNKTLVKIVDMTVTNDVKVKKAK